MEKKPRGTSTRGGTSHLHAIGVVVKALFWASMALAAVLALVSWIVPELTTLRAFDVLDGAVLALAMATSGSLFWREVRADRQDDDEWSPMAWLYATAFGLSLFRAGGFRQRLSIEDARNGNTTHTDLTPGAGLPD